MRYEQIWNWISDNKPDVILEVGTWNGQNALRMLKEGAGKYIGFDIWEEGTQELDEIENNVKKHATREDVLKILEGRDVELIQGNTRETLRNYIKGKKPFVDMAFIDGGHSKATIKSDLLNVLKIVKSSGVVFLDDYYFGCPNKDMGAQSVMAELNLPYTVLPAVDKVKGDYFVKLARIDMIHVSRPDEWDEQERSWQFVA